MILPKPEFTVLRKYCSKRYIVSVMNLNHLHRTVHPKNLQYLINERKLGVEYLITRI